MGDLYILRELSQSVPCTTSQGESIPILNVPPLASLTQGCSSVSLPPSKVKAFSNEISKMNSTHSIYTPHAPVQERYGAVYHRRAGSKVGSLFSPDLPISTIQEDFLSAGLQHDQAVNEARNSSAAQTNSPKVRTQKILFSSLQCV